MKKGVNCMKYMFTLLFMFLTVICHSQTWTISDDENRRDIEYTVITSEQYQRLLRQYLAGSEYCLMEYQDVLEMDNSRRIISGTRPIFNGYYYLLVKIKPQINKLTTEERNLLNLINMTNGLVYGNSNTGAMSIIFTSMYGMLFPGAVENGSSDYTRRYNQFIRFVNGG
jgi:hypothetical protein